MPFLKKTNENQVRRVNTGADYQRPTSVLKDSVHLVSVAEAISRTIDVGFYFNAGVNELEVYHGTDTTSAVTLCRAVDYINGTKYGHYEEVNNYSIRFEPGEISAGDILRFRLTVNSYDRSSINTNNLTQLAKDVYGRTGTLLQDTGESVGSKPIVASTYRAEQRNDSWLNDAALNAALTDIGSDSRSLHVTKGTWSITDDVTIPSNVTLVVDDGASLTVDSTSTFTINGIVFAGSYQIFYGTLANSVVTTYPRDLSWWGYSQHLYLDELTVNTIHAPGIGDATSAIWIRDMDEDTWVHTQLNADEDKIRFATDGTERGIIDDAGRWGIGTVLPADGAIDATLDVASSSHEPRLVLKMVDATIGANDEIGIIKFTGTDGGGGENAPQIGAEIIAVATEGWTVGNAGAALTFWTHTESTNTVTEKMRINQNGRVGIGTTSMAQTLDVSEDSYPTLLIKNLNANIIATDEIGDLEFAGVDSGTEGNPSVGARIRATAEENWVGGTNFGTALRFYTADNTASTLSERVVIDENGYVGIGLGAGGTPSYILEAAGIVAANVFTSRSPLDIRAANTNVIYASDATFDVGIGTTSPSARLDISDSTTVVVARLKRDDPGVNDTDELGTLYFAATGPGTSANPRDGSMIKSVAMVDWTNGNNASDLVFGTTLSGGTSPSEIMRISNLNRVGIGVTAPVEKLQVNGGVTIGDTGGLNEGTLRYHNGVFEGRDSTSWVSLAGSGGGGGGSVWSITGSTVYYNGGQVAVGTALPYTSASFEVADTNAPGSINLKRIDAAVTDTETLGFITFSGTDGADTNSPQIATSIISYAMGTWGAGQYGANMAFHVTPENHDTAINGMRLFGQESGAVRYGQLTINTTATEHVPASSLPGVGLVISTETTLEPSLMVRSASSAVIAGTNIGKILFAGVDGASASNPSIAATINAIATEAWAASNFGTKLEFRTSDDTASTLTRRMTIGQNGNVQIGGTETDEPGTELVVEGGITIGATAATTDGTIEYATSAFTAYENGITCDLIPFKTVGTDHYKETGGLILGGSTASTYRIAITGETTDGDSIIGLRRAYAGASPSRIIMSKARGSIASPTTAVDQDYVGVTHYYAYNTAAAAYIPVAAIECQVEGVSGVNSGGKLGFSVSETAGSGATLAMNIWESGAVGIGIGDTEANESLQVDGGINIGTTVTTNNGTIRYNGSNFQGYKGGTWVNLDAAGLSVGETLFTANDLSPSVATLVTLYRTQNTDPGGGNRREITMFDGPIAGQTFTLLIGDAYTRIMHSSGLINLQGGSDWTPDDGDTISFVYSAKNTAWWETSRSINS